MHDFNPERIPLSDIDTVFLGLQPVPIQMVFHFPDGLDPLLLERSLEQVAPSFWPVFGRLDLSNPLRPQVRKHGDPRAPIALAKSMDLQWSPDLDLNELAEVALPPGSRILGPPSEQAPLCALQITPLKSGGALLGVSINHAIVDGFSFFFFIDQWARASRNEPTLQPVHNRRLHTGQSSSGPFLEDLSLEHFIDQTGFLFQTLAPTDGKNPFFNGKTRFDWETLTLSGDALQDITRQYSPGDDLRRSLNDILCEFLFRQFGPAEGYLTVPVDVRRLSERLKEAKHTYFGNGIRPITLQVSESDRPGSIAHRVGSEVRKLRTEKIEDTLSFLASLKTRAGAPPYRSYKVMDPEKGLLVTNLSRLPLESLRFGTSAPQDLRILTPMFGAAVILPSVTPGGSFIQVSRRLLTRS